MRGLVTLNIVIQLIFLVVGVAQWCREYFKGALTESNLEADLSWVATFPRLKIFMEWEEIVAILARPAFLGRLTG